MAKENPVGGGGRCSFGSEEHGDRIPRRDIIEMINVENGVKTYAYQPTNQHTNTSNGSVFKGKKLVTNKFMFAPRGFPLTGGHMVQPF